MPDNLKDQLIKRAWPQEWRTEPPPDDAPSNRMRALRLTNINLPDPAEANLPMELTLMGLRGAYPEAASVNTISADPYMKVLGAEAAVHPLMPKTIFHRADLRSNQDREGILAHELEHVRAGSQEPNPLKRFFEAAKANVTRPYEQRGEENRAEAAAQAYMKRANARKRDIRLPD